MSRKITRHNISPVGDKNGGIFDNREILIKATRIKRLMSRDSNWSVIRNHLINQFGGRNLLLRITTSDINYINNLLVFYKQIFQAQPIWDYLA